MLPLKRIVCPTDFSHFSYAGIAVASELAAQFGAELCLVHVMEPIHEGLDIIYHDELEQERSDHATQLIDQIIAERIGHGVQTRPVVRSGPAAEEILAAVAEENADLIVIATHGETHWRYFVSGSAVERFIFGSVAESVVRLAKCPVLTVHPGLDEKLREQTPAIPSPPAFWSVPATTLLEHLGNTPQGLTSEEVQEGLLPKSEILKRNHLDQGW